MDSIDGKPRTVELYGSEYVSLSDYLEYQEKCRNRVGSLIAENKKTYNQMMEVEKEYQALISEREDTIDHLSRIIDDLESREKEPSSIYVEQLRTTIMIMAEELAKTRM